MHKQIINNDDEGLLFFITFFNKKKKKRIDCRAMATHCIYAKREAASLRDLRKHNETMNKSAHESLSSLLRVIMLVIFCFCF